MKQSLKYKEQENPQGALDPAVVLPSPPGVKYIMVTQDTSSSLCSERRESGSSDHEKNIGTQCAQSQ